MAGNPGTVLELKNPQRYFQTPTASGEWLAQRPFSSSSRKELHKFSQSVISELRADHFLRILLVFLPEEVNLEFSSLLNALVTLTKGSLQA